MDMTLVDLVKKIGDELTRLDIVLSKPELPTSDPRWQTLYALRVHLDSQQRQLVTLAINLNDAKFQTITDNLEQADAELQEQIASLNKLNDAISTVANIAAWVDQLLALAAG